MENRLKNMSSLLGEYASGNFRHKLKLSDRRDMIDSIANGINMLGEELEAVTVSRNYFNDIFNSVSDMIFLLDKNGVIRDHNLSAGDQLCFHKSSLNGINLHSIYKGETGSLQSIINSGRKSNSNTNHRGYLIGKGGFRIPVRISAKISQNGNLTHDVLITASDISYQVKAENLIVRAVIDIQETERQRLAQDLHDSLIQQLSAIKFYIGTSIIQTNDKKLKNLLSKSNMSLTTAIAGVRNTCFNLMPKTLESFGLVKTIREFFNQFVIDKSPKLILRHNGPVEMISYQLQIDLYRVIQEFISNAVRHGNTSTISITISLIAGNVKLKLKDDGIGFDVRQSVNGMGIANVKSRIRSHNGTIKITSTSKGTIYMIKVPLSNCFESDK